jgi:hypothetical protein
MVFANRQAAAATTNFAPTVGQKEQAQVRGVIAVDDAIIIIAIVVFCLLSVARLVERGHGDMLELGHAIILDTFMVIIGSILMAITLAGGMQSRHGAVGKEM